MSYPALRRQRLIRPRGRFVAAITLALMAAVGTAQEAFAAAVYSTHSYYGPVLGNSYWNRSYGGSSTSPQKNILYSAEVFTNPTHTVPTGYMGAQATLYRTSGAICATTTMTYNNAAQTSWNRDGRNTSCGAGNYTVRGSTAAYNGSSSSNPYAYYYTASSPALAWP